MGNSLIDVHKYPVKDILPTLLLDHSTKKNILFATNAYSTKEQNIPANAQITEDLLSSGSVIIQPRVSKSIDEQAKRTCGKGEVFTPSWICNKMNNHCDAEWFGRENVFNTENEQDWTVNENAIEFPKKKTWKKYIDSRRLEITCGEAPYIVSRYDAATGEIIEINRRIGILDRKLRIVNENTETEDEWIKWTFRAFESVYGYEYQGDNLLIARINLLLTFVDYLDDRWNRKPTAKELKRIAKVLSWNLWQMDGIKGTAPFSSTKPEFEQLSFFDFVEGGSTEDEPVECMLYDWRSKEKMTYNSLKGER